MAPRHKKSKPLKKQSAKKIALSLHRKLAKMEKQVDTKWHDKSAFFTAATYKCFPETDNSVSIYNLTDIPPLSVKNSSANDQFINTANKRIGSKVYISGLYLKMQAYWDNQATGSDAVRYPPYCHINWAVVRQKNNEGGVGADPSEIVPPGPLDVWANPAIQGSVLTSDPDTPLPTGSGAFNDLLFQNMNNSKNYVVLKKGCVYLNGPGNVNTAPAETQTDDQITTFTPASLANAEMRQFGSNAAKTFSLQIHPKCVTQWFQQDTAGVDQTTHVAELLTPIRNGIYLMSWVDIGGASSRFRPPPASGYVYALPSLVANIRTRFRDL